MTFSRLILRNSLRSKLRLALTIAGTALVVAAFTLIQTTVQAWYAGVETASPNRLMTRHAASLSIHLPLAYRERIATVSGVSGVSYANWFGGVYRDAKGFFPQYAVEPASYLDLHPELLLSQDERTAFLSDRRGCLIGRKLAAQHGWKVGDVIPLKGSLYPGDWEFVVRGIYHGNEAATDETMLLFHWNYLNERRKGFDPDRAGGVGWYIVRVANAGRASAVALAIDEQSANSVAETRTETEQAYRMGFVAMSGTLILALKMMALLLAGLTLLVLATALVIAVRERTREYVVLKTLGFRPVHLIGLIIGEGLLLATIGGSVGAALAVPLCQAFGHLLTKQLGNFFRVFNVAPDTLLLALASILLSGAVAALIPAIGAARVRITEGLRHVG